MSVPDRERNWKDIEPRKFDQKCLVVWKLMIRLILHDDLIYREDGGGVKNSIESLLRNGHFGHGYGSCEDEDEVQRRDSSTA